MYNWKKDTTNRQQKGSNSINGKNAEVQETTCRLLGGHVCCQDEKFKPGLHGDRWMYYLDNASRINVVCIDFHVIRLLSFGIWLGLFWFVRLFYNVVSVLLALKKYSPFLLWSSLSVIFRKFTTVHWNSLFINYTLYWNFGENINFELSLVIIWSPVRTVMCWFKNSKTAHLMI